MAWFPISHTVPQYQTSTGALASGYVLKPYASGTSTPINFAIDSAGATQVGSLVLNASGFPASSGNVVIPYVNEKYKLALYATQAAADANTGAIWNPDAIPISGGFGSATQAVSTSTVLNSSDNQNHFEATGTITITLPDINTVGAGFVFTIRNAGTGAVTLDGDGSETINGTATITLYPGDGALVQSGATNWSAVISGRPTQLVNAQTGTTYTVLSTDDRKLVTHSNASAIAVTLPQANSTTFQAGWSYTASNLGVGAVTITPTTSTINGAPTYTLNIGQSVTVTSDGTNYQVSATGSAGLNLLVTTAASAAANVTFSSAYISSTYKSYVIECIDMAGTAAVVLTASTDNGSTYLAGTSYAYINTTNFTDGSAESKVVSAGTSSYALNAGYVLAAAPEGWTSWLRFSNPSSASFYKNIDAISIKGHATQMITVKSTCSIITATAINNIKIAPGSGTITGTFKLYGVM